MVIFGEVSVSGPEGYEVARGFSFLDSGKGHFVPG
jgi:hypothetical protein